MRIFGLSAESQVCLAAVGHNSRITERSADICAVPAAAVVAEAEVAFVLAHALIEKFGGDSIEALDAAVERYRATIAAG